jgi:hypothetical protein
MPRYTHEATLDFARGLSAGQAAVQEASDMLPQMAVAWANARDAPDEATYIYWSGFHRGACGYANQAYNDMVARTRLHRNVYSEWAAHRWPASGAYHLTQYMAFRRTLWEAPRLDPIHIPLDRYFDVLDTVRSGIDRLARAEDLFARALKDRDVALRAASHMIGVYFRAADRAQAVYERDDPTTWTEGVLGVTLDAATLSMDTLQTTIDSVQNNHATLDSSRSGSIWSPALDAEEDEAVYPLRSWINTWRRVAGRWEREVLGSSVPDDGGPTTDENGRRIWPNLSLIQPRNAPAEDAEPGLSPDDMDYIAAPASVRRSNFRYRIVYEPDGQRHWERIGGSTPDPDEEPCMTEWYDPPSVLDLEP